MSAGKLFTRFHAARGEPNHNSPKHIILLHGWGMHSGVWAQTIDLLTEQYDVTVVDLPGYARSKNAVKNIIDSHPAQDFDVVCEQLSEVTDQPALWLGWSLGGLFAMGVALKSPALVEKLIMVASSPRFVSDKNWNAMQTDVFNDFSQQLQENYQLTLKRFMSLQTRNSENSSAVLKLLRQQWRDVETPAQSVLESGLNILQSIDMRDELNKLKCPLSFIYGQLDTLARPELLNDMKDYGAAFNSVIIDKAAHAPFLSHPQQFSAAVKESIENHG